MRLSTGARLGSYEIVSAIGAGGMGEVYRALDTRLGREVAIKVLPEAVAEDAERLGRFEREARVLASLNHPTIAHLYGFETATPSEPLAAGPSAAPPGAASSNAGHQPVEPRTLPFLVMELVEGETLADRLARGPLTAKQAIPLFLQIAEGIESAHEKGIIHRDLKPANIKLSADGRVKILDFGLAKALDPAAGRDSSSGAAMAVTQSPTLTLQATMRGEVLGTPAYMAPEQARGQQVDRRADVWGFGVCLFEALTGHSPFSGPTVGDTLASVLRQEPDWGALPRNLPRPLVELLRRCLEKEPKERLRDIGEARIAIGRLLTDSGSVRSSEFGSASAAGGRRRLVAVGAAAAIVGALITALATSTTLRPVADTAAVPSSAPIRFDVHRAGDATGRIEGLTISPDGRHLVYQVGSELYASRTPGSVRLYDRRLDGFDADTTEIAPGDGGQAPFFSADGRWVAYFTGFGGRRQLQKTHLDDGTTVAITSEPHTGWTASWGADGTIVLGNQRSGLWRLAPGAGAPTPLIDIDPAKEELAHLHPHLLPGDRALIYTVLTTTGTPRLAILDLESGEHRTLLDEGSDGRYVEPGFLLFGFRGELRAVPFDLERRELTGAPFSVVQGVRMDALGTTYYAIADDGTLAYLSGEAARSRRPTLAWVDPEGEITPVLEGDFRRPAVSRDGHRIAAMRQGVQPGLVVIDDAGPPVRVTHSELIGMEALLWSPDGSSLYFDAVADGAVIHRLRADGAVREPEAAATAHTDDSGVPDTLGQLPMAFTPDGRELLFAEQARDRKNFDLFAMSSDGRERRPFLVTEFNELTARLSPRGDLVAYTSDREGEQRVYLTTYPEPTWHLAVSEGLGYEPRWSPDGSEIFYAAGPSLFAARIERKPEPHVVERRVALNIADFFAQRGYDVAPDGRLLMVWSGGERTAEAEPQGEGLHVVLNFFDEIERAASH